MNIVDVAPQRRQSGAMRADSKAVAVRDLGRFTLRLPEETLAAIDRLGGKCVRVAITELIDNTYYAKIYIEQGGSQIELDARPSDAVNIALRAGVPIVADELLLKEPGQRPNTTIDRKTAEGTPAVEND